jgi:phosphoribosylamine--glycine ligase
LRTESNKEQAVRVLVVGRGAREHAIAWKLSSSPSVGAVYCAPGNSGTAADAQNVAIEEDDARELTRFCKRERIDLCVVGPEAPLVAGLADHLRAEGLTVFGPSKDAAQLEGSKVFAKRMMKAARVPTAAFHVFNRLADVEEYLASHLEPSVVKADGLAAGKGVVVCNGAHEALMAAKRMLDEGEFGSAGATVLVEERLTGVEASVFALVDGQNILTLEPCHDYKRAFDGDQGPNTGGMGAVCPTPRLDANTLAEIERDILVPIVHQMRLERKAFQGLLFAGLMLTPNGPKVLEFNVRFGDPECVPLLMRLESDLGVLLMATATGKLRGSSVAWKGKPAMCVVAASGGYPGAFKRGLPIRGLVEAADADSKVFHAGANIDGDRVVTNGGRVLTVGTTGETIAAARAKAYASLGSIRFTGMHFRTDIGADCDEAPSVTARR